jgi:membrane-bound lytic murein transglycosylase D
MRWSRLPASGLMAGVAVLALSLTGCTPTDSPEAMAAQPKQAFAPALAAIDPVQPAQAAGQVRSASTSPGPAPAPPTPEEQHVRVLITQVEAAYTRGSADYQKGMLAEAKEEFDRAVDLMLSSGIDIKSNAELQDEFDKIVDQVNALEMDALKQGNGFVPKEETTPSEAASDITFTSDPNLVAKATADLATTKSDLPLVVNDYVATYINFFANTQKGHNTLLHSFERSGHYKAMIQRVLAEEGVPQDLIYLAVAESGFNPKAIDRKSKAGGMWQFMPGPYYGLTRNTYVDERFDPEKSTRAYARYMKFIYGELGDWYLAMAAYDHGAGNIQHEVAKTGYADFWELYKRGELPKETANYVPEILAAIIIANNPKQYGFDDVTLDPPVLTDTVTVNYSIDLRLVSDLVGAPVDELEALNPSLLRMDTPPDASFDLHLPAGTATLFDQRVALIPEVRRNSWRYHTVVAGDTLASVAEEYRVTASALAEANQLTAGDSIASEALVVPVPPSAEPSARTRMYTVRRGDTLVTIADRFGVSLSQLRSWNAIPAGIRVAPGRRLRVAEPAPVSAPTRHRRGAAGEETTAVGGANPAHRPGGPAARKGSSQAGESRTAARTGTRTGTHSGTRAEAPSRTRAGAGRSTAHSSTHKPGGPAKASKQKKSP